MNERFCEECGASGLSGRKFAINQYDERTGAVLKSSNYEEVHCMTCGWISLSMPL